MRKINKLYALMFLVKFMHWCWNAVLGQRQKHKNSNFVFKEHDKWEKLINWVPTFSLINFFYMLQFHSKEWLYTLQADSMYY